MYFRCMKKIVPGALVEVAYTLHADGPDGEELEVCTEEAPFMFRLGEDEALEAFEHALLEKREGEPFEVLIACEDAYGQETEEAVLALPKETFKVDGKIDLEVMKPWKTTKAKKSLASWWRWSRTWFTWISTTPWQALTCTLKGLWWPSIDGLATTGQRILQQT